VRKSVSSSAFRVADSTSRKANDLERLKGRYTP
jgi:hypothetical protein